MPVVCPKCKRPNADNAQNCIYCKASLQNAAKVEVTSEIKKMAQRFLAEREPKSPAKTVETKKPPSHRARPDAERNKLPLKVIAGGKKPAADSKSFWVVSAPMKDVSDDIVRRVAETIKLEPYNVRNKLVAEAPWVVKRFSEIDGAKELASKLLAAGLDAYSITSQDFNRVPPRLKATKVSLISGGLRFEGEADEEPAVLKWNEAFLIVCGEIQSRPAEQTGKKRRKTATGPRDIMKAYEIIDVYPKKGRGIRIAEGLMDFSGLGKYKCSSSLLNLRWVQNGFDSASTPIVDKGYKSQGLIFRLPLQRIGAILKHGKGTDDEKIYMDNSRHFDEYSTLVYLHYQKLQGE